MQLSIRDQQQPWSYLAPFQRYCRFSAKNSHTCIPREICGCFHSTRSQKSGLRRLYANYPVAYRMTTNHQRYRRTDRRTDRLTDRQLNMIAIPRYACICNVEVGKMHTYRKTRKYIYNANRKILYITNVVKTFLEFCSSRRMGIDKSRRRLVKSVSLMPRRTYGNSNHRTVLLY